MVQKHSTERLALIANPLAVTELALGNALKSIWLRIVSHPAITLRTFADVCVRGIDPFHILAARILSERRILKRVCNCVAQLISERLYESEGVGVLIWYMNDERRSDQHRLRHFDYGRGGRQQTSSTTLYRF